MQLFFLIVDCINSFHYISSYFPIIDQQLIRHQFATFFNFKHGIPQGGPCLQTSQFWLRGAHYLFFDMYKAAARPLVHTRSRWWPHWRHCVDCSRKVSRHWWFCSGCGRRLHESPETDTESGEHSESDDESQILEAAAAAASTARPTRAKRVRFN